MLVILLRKQTITLKLQKLNNKFNNHNHDKYITTPEFNTLAAHVFNARLSQASLVAKIDFDAKLLSFNRKIMENKIKHLLVQNELNELKTFDCSYFIGKSHFEEDGTQNYLVFQPLNKYFKVITNTNYVSSWKSKGLSDENIIAPTTSDYKLNPKLSYFGVKAQE